ncbi:patatin-like protein 7 isoform X1 [Elaeis guineensis]|uniref:Patatin n=1 Tax=Elaeis guineensis var. tenera TaxID=51953 RepID=A0A6I9R4P0_ELAGV|nr:patatin-like protein 7 isoform X1 [Elaeis guineensis]
MAAAEEMLVAMHQGKKEGEEDPSVDTDKLSYEIFSILESKFLFGYDDHKLWVPKPSDTDAAATTIKNQRGKVRVLCIDGGGGGGMRGILPGKALAYLEQALQAKSGDTNARISDYFDVVAGTGVGGLFAAMIVSTRDGARPQFRADDTWRFLADQGKRFFRKPRSSSSSSSSSGGFLRRVFHGGGGVGSSATATAAMEKALKEALGEGTTLRDTVKPVLIPCFDLRSSAPLVFSRADALESESYDFRLWEVCRATWAEPGRFAPAEMRSVDRRTACLGVDGGLAMSNPAAAAITHVLHNKQEFPFVRGVEDLLVLSLGCGSGGAAVVPEEEHPRLRRWGPREWARPIARIASDGAADLVDHAVALAFGQCRSSNYVRIQANCTSMGECGVDVDSDPSPGNVRALLGAAEEMLKQKTVESVMFGGKRMGEQTNMEKLDWFAGELVLEHQRRSCRIAPTVAFKQAAPKPTQSIRLFTISIWSLCGCIVELNDQLLHRVADLYELRQGCTWKHGISFDRLFSKHKHPLLHRPIIFLKFYSCYCRILVLEMIFLNL